MKLENNASELLMRTFTKGKFGYTRLSKVAGCQQKVPHKWLVSASYSAWHFFADDVFLKKISLDCPLTLTTQPSTSNISDNPGYTGGPF